MSGAGREPAEDVKRRLKELVPGEVEDTCKWRIWEPRHFSR